MHNGNSLLLLNNFKISAVHRQDRKGLDTSIFIMLL